MGKIDLSVDAVIFGYENGLLFILLIQRKKEPFQNAWALPGGFVEEYEPLEDAAKRELEEETGIRVHRLHQVYAFGKPDRDPRKRVVSIAHVGLVRKDLHIPRADDDAKDAAWFPMDEWPELAFDHAEIIAKAKEYLGSRLREKPADMEAEFSESELHGISKMLLR